MKKLNTKSDCYYIERMVGFKPLNLSKLYIIDDNCSEFIVTVTGTSFLRGYVSPSEIRIIDCEEYTAEKWDEMERFIEYERAILTR